DRMRHQAFHDALTGLPNQLLFEERLSNALAQAREEGEQIAVLYAGLDRFTRVNDSLGHHAGNELLRLAAHRLERSVRPGDTVARMGGDEFTVLLTGLREPGDAAALAHRLVEAFRAPFVIGPAELFVTISVGGARYPDHGDRPASLVATAGAAMGRAKQAGRDRHQI